MNGDLSNLPFTATLSYDVAGFTKCAYDTYCSTASTTVESISVNGVTQTLTPSTDTECEIYTSPYDVNCAEIGQSSANPNQLEVDYTPSDKPTLADPQYPGVGSIVYLYLFPPNGNVSDSLYGTVGPTILFNGMAVGASPNPVPIVVGQPINLMGTPGPGQSPPWTVPGSIIGGYEVNNCPPPKKTRLRRADSGCTATVTSPNLTQQSTQFYWTQPGTYSVTYASNDGTANATFAVAGPSDPNIVVDKKNGSVRSVGVVTGKSGTVYLGCNVDPCITFTPEATIPNGIAGSFLWIQTLIDDKATLTTPTGSHKCSVSDVLDHSYPYPFFNPKRDGEFGTEDNAAVNLTEQVQDDVIEVDRTFGARMYLAWQADQAVTPGSIPVSLGYVAWGFTASATYNGGTWSANPSPLNVEAFYPTNANPIWKHVSLKGPCGQTF